MDTSDIVPDSRAALDEAITLAGGNTKLAQAVNEVSLPMPGVSPKGSGHVGKWKARGMCPPDMALRIEAATKGRVSRHRLRPDVFGFEPIEVPRADEAAA